MSIIIEPSLGGPYLVLQTHFFALLFDQILQRRGLKCRVWLRSAEIRYLKPGATDLYFTISLSEQQIQEAVSNPRN
jgi:hypothetical protein